MAWRGQLAALMAKEARLLARRPREALLPAGLSGVAGLAVASFASGPDAALSGLIAVQLFLSYYLALQGMVREQAEGSLDGLRLSPVDPILVVAAKAAASASLLALGSAVYVTALALFSSPPPASPLGLIAWSLALTPGLAGISGLASSMLAYSSEPGLLAPHVTAALSAPLYLASVEHGVRAAAGDASAALNALIPSAAAALLAVGFARLALE